MIQDFQTIKLEMLLDPNLILMILSGQHTTKFFQCCAKQVVMSYVYLEAKLCDQPITNLLDSSILQLH